MGCSCTKPQKGETPEEEEIVGDHIAKQDVTLWSYEGDQMSPTHIAKGTAVEVVLVFKRYQISVNFVISGADARRPKVVACQKWSKRRLCGQVLLCYEEHHGGEGV